MNTNNNYVNMFNSYGFGDQQGYFETYPEERRNWRKAIKSHVDDAMGITDEQIAEGDNMTERLNEAHTDINNNIESARANINSHVTAVTGVSDEDLRNNNNLSKKLATARESIEDDIEEVKSVVDEINAHIGWSTSENKTVVKRLQEIKSNTDSMLGWSSFFNNNH